MEGKDEWKGDSEIQNEYSHHSCGNIGSKREKFIFRIILERGRKRLIESAIRIADQGFLALQLNGLMDGSMDGWMDGWIR